MPRPIKALIHLDALRHNLARAQAALGGSSKVWAVVKANAYGHGIEPAVAAFEAADGLALLDLDEAVRAREAGWTKPILQLEGPFDPSDLEVARQYQLTPVIHHLEQLQMLEASSGTDCLDLYVKLDTGMTRLGFVPEDFDAALQRVGRLQSAGRVGKVTLMTHFACADRADGLEEPLARFLAMAGGEIGQGVGQSIRTWCLSNSAACLMHAKRIENFAREHDRALWSRPGICLYGGSPLNDLTAADLGLMPAMTLCSELISVKQVAAGQGIGYGYTFVTDRPMRVGVVACGYADGYPRHAPTGTPVSVAGRQTRILGRVSMDMIMVDLSDMADVGVGAKVVLWGEQGPTADEVAKAAGTISYELLSGVTARVPRLVG